MEKIFKLKEHGTNVKTEILAGLTTFLAMAYILAVNPSLLGVTGMDQNAVFVATALSAAIATFVMGFFANYPVALASGMGLNAYFTYSVCLGMGLGNGAWRIALTAVLIEGIIFIVLSLFKFREKIVNGIPENLKYGITAGIGLFISMIGLKGAGIIRSDASIVDGKVSSSTLVALGDFASPTVVLALIGVILIGVLTHYHVKAAILLGILATWLLGIFAELSGWYVVNPAAGVYSNIPSFANYTPFPSIAPTFMQFDFNYVAQNTMNFIIIVFAFLFVDLFDTVGTLVGVASKGNLLNEKGELPRAGRALLSDAVGTVVGACLGTSTVTSFVESSAGVAEGGRTGLTAVTSGVLFLIAIPLYPIFTAIQGFATAPALIFVGLLMMSSVLKMKFSGDLADAVGGFLAIIMMPFTYSIANGIMFGMLSWVIIKIFTGKIKDISPIMYVVGGLFVLRIITLAMHIA
ncbi:MAG: NCS2 family permease [Clostridiales bacterium]|nr:NCS2 family permease [Clostridiales bacterium]MCI2161372.1 NCS2 family permease [Oscillospiraceae bacterium]CAB1241940.1 Xanthine/uracil/thiamine/ascorbate permease family protein [Ruminococcaceae bacterium BL-4]MCI1961678.1 NCS2 family permease [Clostridiales bacterium]MCI2021913.1 NCS2 family permease [Clostridiales bacterium]